MLNTQRDKYKDFHRAVVSKHARLEITLDAHLKGTDCNYFHVHTREATSRCRRSDLTAVNGKRPGDVSVTIRLM